MKRSEMNHPKRSEKRAERTRKSGYQDGRRPKVADRSQKNAGDCALKKRLAALFFKVFITF